MVRNLGVMLCYVMRLTDYTISKMFFKKNHEIVDYKRKQSIF